MIHCILQTFLFFLSGSDPVIYFRRRKDIAQVDPAGLDPQTAIRRVGNIRSFDVHYESKSVYWINGRVPSIGMSPLDENGRTEVCITKIGEGVVGDSWLDLRI